MKKNCQQCNKEFEAKRKDAKYCGDACRQAAKRGTPRNVTEPLVTGKEAEDVTLKEITVAIEDVCTPEEIRDFPAMCETKRLRAESVYRLENNSLEDLEKKKIFIPNWRRMGNKPPMIGKG